MKTLTDRVAGIIEALRGVEGSAPSSSQYIANTIIDAIKHDNRIEPKGTPIEQDNVRKGDHVRIEYSNGDVVQKTVEDKWFGTVGDRVYLLDRPDPDADFVFPTGKGAIVRMKAKVNHISPALASPSGEYWAVTGRPSVYTEEELRSEYCDFEVLSDGSDQ